MNQIKIIKIMNEKYIEIKDAICRNLSNNNKYEYIHLVLIIYKYLK